MLYTLAVILLIAWLLGVVGTYTIGAFVHGGRKTVHSGVDQRWKLLRRVPGVRAAEYRDQDDRRTIVASPVASRLFH